MGSHIHQHQDLGGATLIHLTKLARGSFANVTYLFVFYFELFGSDLFVNNMFEYKQKKTLGGNKLVLVSYFLI